MKSLLLLVALGSLAHADHTAADCEPAVKKMWPVVQDLAAKQNVKLGDADRAKMVSGCKDTLAKDPKEPTVACVLDAKDDAAVRACLTTAFKTSSDKAKATEAALQLNKLGKNAKVYFITNTEFPKGKAATLPEKPCCPQADHKCAVTNAWEKDKVWSALDFQIDEPNLYQYTYQSDGKTFHATATGDIGCTGKPKTVTLDGHIENGNPVVKVTE